MEDQVKLKMSKRFENDDDHASQVHFCGFIQPRTSSTQNLRRLELFLMMRQFDSNRSRRPHGANRRRHTRTPESSAATRAEAFAPPYNAVSISSVTVPANRSTLTISEKATVIYTESALMASLLQEIRDLKTAVRRIESHPDIGREAILLREIPDEEARIEVMSAFRAAGDEPLYYDDLSERLRLPIEQVARVCEALIAEGVLGEKIADER